MLTVGLRVVQCLEPIVTTDDMVGIQLDSSPDSPANKIHILKYDLYDKGILAYMHNSIYFLLQKSKSIKVVK